MVNVSVKAPDIGFKSADTGKSKSTGANGTSSDQFRKLLQGKQDDIQADSKTQETSKDVKQDKTEAPKDVKKDTEDDSKADGKEDSAKTEDNSQAQEMLAAYQLGQGLRPELIQAEPEVVIEVPEITLAKPETEAVDAMAAVELTPQMEGTTGMELQAGTMDAGTAQQVQTETMIPAETKVQEADLGNGQEVQTVSAENVQPVSNRVNEVKDTSADNKKDTQTENPGTEHAAAAMTQAPVRAAAEEIKPQEVVTVQVPHAEELPDKVADQLLSKISEGVQEFEIHIEPENLGKIAVKVLYEDGQATVSIFCTEKKTLDLLGNNARDIGNIIERNLGGETKIFVEKQETDYLDQNRDENQHGKQEEQRQQKEEGKKEDAEDAEQFLQKLRLGLMG